ncbi:TVP38/TMEM64 family protein [Allosalinactinospora lopnorensis]|uniref:TVP38/TMEM64 family protein n=1 Tax=Allosalinactinospora lopnorensis TaxID=1352348 RepID=UPI0006968FA8|nr:VTT domain-containing protein [Allosalinactinospora lopnorensis]
MTERPGVRAAVFASWLVAVAVIGGLAPDLAALRHWIGAAGPAALVVYLAGYVAASLVFVPRPVLNAMAGVAFTAWLGVAAALAGGLTAALVQFGLARFLAHGFVAARPPSAIAARIDRVVRRHGVLAVIQLRLLPVVPFAAVNYGLGLTRLGVVPFVAGTVLGSLPATAALVVLGDTVSDPLSPGFLLPLGLFFLLLLASRLVGAYTRRLEGVERPPA